MSKKLFVVVVIVLSFLIGNSTKAGEHIYSQFSRAIVRLEQFKSLEGENRPVGTAFFVRVGNELFIVTARHVAQQDYDLHARVTCKNTKTGQIEVILLKLPRDRWVYHPEQVDEDSRYVDVAAMKITGPGHLEIKHFNKEKHLSFKDPEPPDTVLVFGFPYDIGFDLSEQRPFGRSGIVSISAGERFLKIEDKFVEPKACVIDIEAFPGNSGSPVINQFIPLVDPDIKVLGLVIATNINMDFAIIEPVSRIRETLEIATKQSVEDLQCWFLLIKDWPYSMGGEGAEIGYKLNTLFFPTADFLTGPEKYFVYQVFERGGQVEMSLIDEVDDKFQEIGYSTDAITLFNRLCEMNIFKKMPIDRIVFEEPYLSRTLDFLKFHSVEKFREHIQESYQKELREKLLEKKSTNTQPK